MAALILALALGAEWFLDPVNQADNCTELGAVWIGDHNFEDVAQKAARLYGAALANDAMREASLCADISNEAQRHGFQAEIRRRLEDTSAIDAP